MNALFSSCLSQPQNQYDKLTTVLPQPIKFKIAYSLNLINFILKYFAQPRKTQKYTFSRSNLYFLTNQNCHVPLIYFPAAFPETSLLIIYCHGSGSTLNNVYDFAYTMSVKYGVAFIAYDYTGDGESQKIFHSYQEDVKLVLAWAIKLGYRLNRTIFCGFSLGSYSALCIQGEMPRILISPICGIISFFQTQAARYQNQKYDNVQKALNLKCKSLVFHCSQELVHISHGKLLQSALQFQNQQQSIFYQIKDKIYHHKSAPSFLCSPQGQKVIISFLSAVNRSSKKVDLKDNKTLDLKRDLQQLYFSIRNESGEQTNNQINCI